MIFDRKEHKDIVLHLLENGSFSGKILELVLELKQAVIKAFIELPEKRRNDVSTTGKDGPR